jgi:hypothetical protein
MTVTVLVLKWLLITAAMLVVPFTVWWVIDRSRSRAAAPAAALAGAVPVPRPAPIAPVAVVAARPAPGPVTTPDPVTTPVLPPARPARRAPSRTHAEPVVVRPFLAPDRRVDAIREDDHQATLARHHRDRPVTRVTAEIRASVATGGPQQGTYALEVRIDGDRVGELTIAASARYRRLVDTTPEGAASCLGTISYGERGYRIELRLPKGR